MIPGLGLAARTLAASGALAALIATVTAAVVTIDGGPDVTVGPVVAALAPLVAAVGAALASARDQAAGAWTAWAVLGVGAGRLAAPSVVLAAGIGAALAVAPPSPPGGASLAPWDGRAEARWDGDGWVAAPAPSFSVAASRLPLDALLARAATRPAPGLRAGVDCAELLRRCLLAVGISALTASGLAIGRARGVREGGDIVLRAALRAGAAGAAWCCASAVAVASVAL